MSATPIMIVGAGPSGLNLALQLARRGVGFRIIDKADGPGTASRAMAVHARTLEFYRQLGFADEVVVQGIHIEVMHIREQTQEVAQLRLGIMGAGLSPFPYVLTYPQDDHERLLVAKLKEAGVEVEWNTELKSFSQTDDRVRVVLAKGSTEKTCDVEYLCGCDGGHSQVRRCLDLDFPGGTNAQLFYVADVKIAGDFDTNGTMNLGPNSLALKLPVRSRGMQRLIGLVPTSLTDRKDLTFEDLRSSVEPLIGAKVESVNWFSTYHSHHRVAAHFRVGRCFIAGDAGHIHSPAGGQGMNTGIGDAVNLAWKLADVVRGRARPEILDTYETERIAFARKLVATTDQAFTNAIRGGIVGQIVRTWLVPHVIPLIMRLPQARRLAFRTLSQTRITYRGSALSEGDTGRIRGGDRLPWVERHDNFKPLTSLDWQIHVYGDTRRPLQDAANDLHLPVHAFGWTEAIRSAGLERNAAYLIRPDGYVALALSDQDPRALRAYCGNQGLSLGG